MGSSLSKWWAPFLPGPERTNCEGALCEQEGSSCRQLNRCSVGSPLDTVIACLLKAGQWGLSLAEEFHSTRQRTHKHTLQLVQPCNPDPCYSGENGSGCCWSRRWKKAVKESWSTGLNFTWWHWLVICYNRNAFIVSSVMRWNRAVVRHKQKECLHGEFSSVK